MSKYLIVAVRLEAGEVIEADVRRLTLDERSGEIGFGESPGVVGRADLANLVIFDEVFAATNLDGPGAYGIGRRCARKSGQMEFITTVDENGAQTDDLLQLPPLR